MDGEEKIENLGFDFNKLTCFILFSTLLSSVLVCRVVYLFIRSKFPITVNCWFCNTNASVPYKESNSWTCPHCEQYNGFTADGSYNKEIKEQFETSLNNKIYSQAKFAFPSTVNNGTIRKNGLCDSCNINQELKVQQLANFIPLDDENFDEEIEEFSKKLELSYELCYNCRQTLDSTIKHQTYNILKDRLNSERIKSQTRHTVISRKLKPKISFDTGKIKMMLLTFTRSLSLMINIIVFLTYLYDVLITNTDLINVKFENYLAEMVKKGLMSWLEMLSSVQTETTGLIFTLFLISSYGRQFRVDFLCLLACAVQHAFSWTDFHFMQLLTSSVATVLNAASLRQKQMCFKKNVLAASETGLTNSPVTEPVVKWADDHLNSGKESLLKMNVKTNGSGYFTRSKAQEIQQRAERDSDNESEISFLSRRTANRRRKRFVSPPPEELFTNLNGLHLSQDVDTRTHTLDSHTSRNDSDRVKRELIKPSKLFKSKIDNWVSGGTWGGEDPSPTRSSTPSSGYTSQSSQKIDADPLSSSSVTAAANPFLKIDASCNYQPRSAGLYVPPPSSATCYAPMFSPLSQTGVYTYSTPVTDCYPRQFHYVQQPWNTSHSIDTSLETKSACSTIVTHDKWFVYKQCLYNASAVLNIISFCVVMYGLWFQWIGR